MSAPELPRNVETTDGDDSAHDVGVPEDTEWGTLCTPLTHNPAEVVEPNNKFGETSDNINDDNGGDDDDEEDVVEVAIIGGGLTGLAVAIGLRRANIPCKVFERSPQLRSTSQGILGVQPNGLRALENIHPDLPALVTAAGCEVLTVVATTIRADGTVEEIVRDMGAESLAEFGRRTVNITWHKMQQVLASLLPSGVVVTSRSLVSFTETDNDVVLRFDDHHSSEKSPIRKRVRAKAVLACDGVFSAARRQMMMKDDHPLYFGQLNWATVIATKELPPNVHPPGAIHAFQYEGEPRWASMMNDCGAGFTFWQLRVVDPDQALSLSCNKGRGGLGLPGVKVALLPVAKPCQMIYEGIQCIPERQIFERSIIGRLPAPTWVSKGQRLVLVGDSAHGMHPHIGQGGNSSFESAAAVVRAMAEEYGHHSGNLESVDWTSALQTFEQRRKPRATIVQRWANMMGCYQATGKLAMPKEVAPKMRNWIVGEDDKDYPDRETLHLLFAFDPCSQPGVSLMC